MSRGSLSRRRQKHHNLPEFRLGERKIRDRKRSGEIEKGRDRDFRRAGVEGGLWYLCPLAGNDV